MGSTNPNSFTNPFALIAELPIERRKYERKWDIPTGTCRINMYDWRDYACQAETVAGLAEAITDSKTEIQCDFWEFYGKSSVWRERLGREINAISSSGLSARTGLSVNSESVLTVDEFHGSTLARNRHDLAQLLKETHPVEWFVYAEDSPTHRPPIILEGWLHPKGKWRPEQYYLADLERLKYCFFFSRDHALVELYSCERTVIEHVLAASPVGKS